MKFLNDYFKYSDNLIVSGLTEELNVLYICNYFENNDENVLITTTNMYEANKYYQLLRTYTEDVYLFPMDDFLTSVAVAVSPDLQLKRVETINEIQSHKKSIVVTHLMGYLKHLTFFEEFKKDSIVLEKNTSLKRDNIISLLETFGYKKTDLVTTTGEYAIRGFIIDIFLFDQNYPLRIELFGDEIESLRLFDVENQRSIKDIAQICIKPISETIGNRYSSIYDYLNNPQVFYIDYDMIISSYKRLSEEIIEYNVSKGLPADHKYMFSFEEIHVNKQIFINNLVDDKDALRYNSSTIENFGSDFDLLKKFIQKNQDKTTVFFLSTNYQIEKISELFNNVNIGSIEKNMLNIINKKINSGFIFDKYLVISEYDIEKTKRFIQYKSSYKLGKKIKNYSDLETGDYVVHSSHGIGIYGGIITLSKNGLKKDYLLINYAENDKIYVPVEKVDTIYKYADKDGIKPKIDRLNSSSWAKTKLKVRNKIKDISNELMKLYALRSFTVGDVYHDFPDEDIFATDFPYEETIDQLKCINEINADLKSVKPMERLLCGDVGFGKTEVAFRAIFKAVLNGKQVAYLCPTTLLSRQQYYNAKERFCHFPVNIALLNRFTSTKDFNRIIMGLKNGTIDVVFGTHKLFNSKIAYKQLGLLIIDEEQRFGVAHKEKIKELKNDINVLTLSATPIPRTLKMAMSGLKDLSIIDTPPINRYPVQTYVIEENTIIMKDAIYRELSRGGQVYILYNSVEKIENFTNKISSLIPDANVVFAHGQMERSKLEDVVESFLNNEFDILVCTTIIETGIDIPNVNTLIIVDADRFGLSQLYQIRGRVGRSNRIAYAYLMYKPEKVLTETAIKRLKSIKDFTELGSGYKIAMRDLSIRGAGELLGSEQAGFVESVGIELYLKMLDDEVRRLKGEEVEEDDQDTSSLINVETHINDSLTTDESLIIEIHKLINTISDSKTFKEDQEELEDRFGNLEDNIILYMYEEWFEHLAKKLKITNVKQLYNLVEIELPEEISSKVKGDRLFLEVYQINMNFKLRYFNKRIFIALKTNNLAEPFLVYLIKLLELIISNIGEV